MSRLPTGLLLLRQSITGITARQVRLIILTLMSVLQGGKRCYRKHRVRNETGWRCYMKFRARFIGCSMAVLIGGCATVPTGPSVLALPGTGKTLNEFRLSDTQCYQYAAQSIDSAAGSESSRNYGYDAQRRYDNAYIQCMYSSGHKVPVSASMAKSLTQLPLSPASAATIPPPPPNQTPPSSPPPDYLPAPASR
jgi:hypothetical protein